MDENTQNRMFEPFFTTKPAGEGTGMGLSTSHGIIAGHDGIIKVTSRVGSGSSFDVYLPTLEHDAPAEAHADDSDDLRGCERVLFVDDELQLCDLGKALLESFGYQVDCRTASTEALEVFRRRAGDFDLVITDQTMPQMTGYELARKMLEIREDIPIILMTGYSEAVTPEKASVLGIRGYVMKPFLATDMAKAIREACGCPEARGNRQP